MNYRAGEKCSTARVKKVFLFFRTIAKPPRKAARASKGDTERLEEGKSRSDRDLERCRELIAGDAEQRCPANLVHAVRA